MKQVRVYSVVLVSQLGQYLVTLEEIDGIRLIPIWIGPTEGMAIGSKLEGQRFSRPLTHDLISNILDKLNAKLERVIVTDLKDSTFYANMHILVNGNKINIDSRPSDAIALAVRSNADIYVTDTVFKKCPVIQKPISEKEVKNFKRRIEDLKPEDFFRKP